MDFIPRYEDSVQISRTQRLRALFEILLLSGVPSSFLAMYCFSFIYGGASQSLLKDPRILALFLIFESGITYSLLFAVLKVHGETMQSIGLHRNRWKSHFIVGLIVVPFLFAVNDIVVWVLQVYLPRYYMKGNPIIDNIRTSQDLALTLVAAIIAGGILEELQRALILNRFSRYLGGAPIGLVLWSIIFGMGHYLQGTQAIVSAGIYSIIFGMLYLLRRSLIAPITAHCIYNTLTLLGYWFYFGHQ